MSKISFNNQGSPFFKALKERVNNYFKENNIPNTGNRKLYIKSSILVTFAIANFITLVFFTPHIAVSVFLCVLLGFNLAAIGFNIMHDGGHQSFSRSEWLNTISGYSLNMMGGTIYFWKQKHNIAHHTYTNIDGLDHDIDIKFMRIHEEQPRRWYHRFQIFYWILLYGISYIAWVLYQDFEKYFSGKMGIKAERKAMPAKEHLIFWLTKVLYVAVYIVLPIVMVGWLPAVLGILITGMACGYSLAIVFQLAHVVESTHFPEPDKSSNKIEQEWAIHQLRTTANFSTKSKVVCWLLGGLNFQVEHHLFPRISHVHYPAINRLVKQTCKDFNVIYLEHKTMGHAFVSHMKHIYRLGVSG